MQPRFVLSPIMGLTATQSEAHARLTARVEPRLSYVSRNGKHQEHPRAVHVRLVRGELELGPAVPRALVALLVLGLEPLVRGLPALEPGLHRHVRATSLS